MSYTRSYWLKFQPEIEDISVFNHKPKFLIKCCKSASFYKMEVSFAGDGEVNVVNLTKEEKSECSRKQA